MSRKKYWLAIHIETRNAHATRSGSYRSKAPLVTTYSKTSEIRRRKTVDVLLFIFTCVFNIVEYLEKK